MVLFSGKMTIQAEATGTGLVDKFQGDGFTLELGDQFVDGIDAVADLPIVKDLTVETIGGDDHIDGLFMHIHSDKEYARF
jgi:hypothetical protein